MNKCFEEYNDYLLAVGFLNGMAKIYYVKEIT